MERRDFLIGGAAGLAVGAGVTYLATKEEKAPPPKMVEAPKAPAIMKTETRGLESSGCLGRRHFP